ncbi:hypothetical protein OIE62_41365 (plasmid) [Streptomyces scopuliridis]|uniref:Uncharacterized protein n=1 Tax=Streptomyces scopuliridis TaxID=452529 RepID=A0ACD4ZYU4_9ACTN|nr:hypothetical protein [Streptomyces scopuliridis]WSC03496.1 hypothetical protein OG835_42130 [Streptomyces scopuliridis]WSC11359.1 hypothetical protein OIE62_41365 [Streptomyces scopuliridis]
MSGEESFRVDPEPLHMGEAELAELGSYAWGILAEFVAIMSDTSWTGGDENGEKIKAWVVSTCDAISGSLKALGEVLERTSEATLLNLNATSSTQSDILDGIDQEINAYDIGGGGSDGGRRG